MRNRFNNKDDGASSEGLALSEEESVAGSMRTDSVGSAASDIDDSPLLKGPKTLEEELALSDWPVQQRSLLYEVVMLIVTVALETFFSKIEIVNEENIPPEGPTLLFGNHSNQFVDGMIMTKAAERPVSYIAAQVSYDKPVIGDLLKACDAVPVKRPQDYAVAGRGRLLRMDLGARRLFGEGTAFTSEVEKGHSVGNKSIGTVFVERVISDTELEFKMPRMDANEGNGVRPDLVGEAPEYKITPKIDQGKMFEKVTDALSQGKCIGIFPEGGSHDRTELLPLKVGVAMMALDARAKGVPVKVIPVGINYFSGHVFRSSAFVDVGKPLHISSELVRLYQNPATKRHACSQLLEEMKSALEMVLLQAPDYETLKVIRTTRRIYQGRVKLTAKEYVELNIRFTSAYYKWKNEPEFAKLQHDIHEYLESCRGLGLSDKEVRDLMPLGSLQSLFRSIYDVLLTIVLIIVVFPLVLPGLLLNYPLIHYAKYQMPREMEKALKNSSVKLAARDVSASLQIMKAIKIIPALHVVYSLLWVIFFILTWPYYAREPGTWGHLFVSQAWWLLPLAFFFLGPLYTFQFCPKMIEKISRNARLMPRYLFTIKSFFFAGKRFPGEQLRHERKKLTVRTQDLVERFIHSFPEWNNERIINRAKLLKKRSKSIKSLARQGLSQPELLEPKKFDNMPSRPSFEKNLNLLGGN